MLRFDESILNYLSIHHVGNKINDEDLILSSAHLNKDELPKSDLLLKYFLSAFNEPEWYNFTFTNEDFNLNPLFQFATNIFESPRTLHTNSKHIAKHLFETSDHPQIKSGDLFVAYIKDLVLDGELMQGVGIFKAENKQSFLKVNRDDHEFTLDTDDGINTDKLDKGCLILDCDADSGYKICLIDKSNKTEAQFWKEKFLMVKPSEDNFFQTKGFLDIAKVFVTKQLSEEFEINKTDQIDMLNRSMDYFKTRENFDKKEFEKEVFQDTDVIKSFRSFDHAYREENNLELDDNFEISVNAVKQQNRVFKSVLKLDKNFHIYIHGDKSLIEQGVEKDGRKYYKIYFDKES